MEMEIEMEIEMAHTHTHTHIPPNKCITHQGRIQMRQETT